MFAYCLNNPVNNFDPDGRLPKIAKEVLEKFTEWVATPLGMLRYVTEKTKQGDLYEHWYDKNDVIQWSRHHSNHGNGKKHPIVPHDHEWYDDDDGNHKPKTPGTTPNEAFKAPEQSNTTKIVANVIGAAAGYGVYLGVKWLVAACAAPCTGGFSLALAGVTP